ncbi:hypothetical protein MSPP1_002780 [Malassezia sp. CBS 17886]|nr:hypothetical protein MSPP1_002780 [Malassezia sp. CBS 17886]
MGIVAIVHQVVIIILAYALRVHDWTKQYFTRGRRPAIVPGVHEERIQIPSRDPGRSITAYKYTPEGATGALPVFLYWHASGFVLKRLRLDAHMLSLISSKLQCVVLGCDYRKGPENKFPAADQDAEDRAALTQQAVLHVLAHPTKYDTSRITVGGSSAGGMLALVMCAVFGPKLKGCFALYPPSVMASPGKPHRAPNDTFRSGIILAPWMFSLFIAAYAPRDLSREPRFNPLIADVSQFPEHVLIACGDADVLWNDGRLMIEKVQREGMGDHKTHARFLSVKDEAHEFNTFPATPETIAARDDVYGQGIAVLRAAMAS